MSDSSLCPVCGSRLELQNPGFGSQFPVNNGQGPIIASPDGDIELPSGGNPESYFHCSVCPRDLIFSELIMEELMPNLKLTGYAEMLLNHYFGIVPIKEIFTNVTTILIKKPLSQESFLTKAKAEKQIIFITIYGDIKIFGTILKNGRNSYKMTTMERV